MPKKYELKQSLSLLPSEPMTSFCYQFSKLLLGKLEKMREKNEVFTEVSRGTSDSGEERIIVTPLSESILAHLTEQTKLHLSYDAVTKKELDEFISNIKEFLSIFEREI